MKKYILSGLLIGVFALSFLKVPIARAYFLAPYLVMTVNEHAPMDGTFNFHIYSSSSDFPFVKDFPITTSAGAGTHTEESDTVGIDDRYYITEGSALGWSAPTVACTSDNPSTVFTPTDNGIVITRGAYSRVTCDFTNTPAPQGNSNIIFVPGFEGSRLYEKKPNGNLIQRWESGILSPSDTNSLFMDDLGNSIKNIVTKDIIERTNHFPDSLNENFYKSFADVLRASKSAGTINDFFLLPYDWRLDVDTLTRNGSQTDTGMLTLKDKIVALATTSKTGKVTLIGHSDGGLLIKETMALLEQSGQANLIDKVVLVDSPQLGTPGVLDAILHGDDTRLAGGLILGYSQARALALNMPGSYGLLPSEKLYQKIGSFITFDSSTPNNWQTLYGNTLEYSEQANFLTGGDGRKQPGKNQLAQPAVLQKSILDKATSIHSTIDNLVFPSSVPVYEITGVGFPTVTGMTYKNPVFTFDTLMHTPTFSCDGDQTVVSESAIDYGLHPQYLNIYSYAKDTSKTYTHADILENPEMIDAVSNIVLGTNKTTPHITQTMPSLAACNFKVIGMHSPANLDVYDSAGNHLGINQSQSTDAFTAIDTDIPGSEFFTIGDEKYAIVPDGAAYTVKIDGTGTGLFTLDVRDQSNAQTTSYDAYANLPVTPDLKGQLVIPATTTTTPPLQLDTDGNGTIDQTVTPNTGTDSLSYLAVFRATIVSLDLTDKTEKKILAKIDTVAKLLKKGKVDAVTQKMQKFLVKINAGKGDLKDLTEAQKNDLADQISNFLDSI